MKIVDKNEKLFTLIDMMNLSDYMYQKGMDTITYHIIPDAAMIGAMYFAQQFDIDSIKSWISEGPAKSTGNE